jgi:hypothetical protein
MGRVLVATVVVLAVCYSPAQAATTVAKVGDLSLRAREKGGRLCITLFRNVRNYQGMACGRVPRSPHRPLVIFPDTFVDHYVAAVAPSVRIAETEDRKGRRARYRTFPGRGFGVRFVLIPAPPSPVFVRFYGVGGWLLGMDAGLAGYITMEDNVARILGEPGHDVTVHTEPRIAPTPDQADRIPHPHARLRGRDQRQRRPFHLDEPATLMLRVLLERAAARRPGSPPAPASRSSSAARPAQRRPATRLCASVLSVAHAARSDARAGSG